MSAGRAARQVGLGLVSRASTQVSALVLMLIAGRVLAPDGFGTYALASLFVIVLQAFMYTGMYEYIIRSSEPADVRDTAFWCNMGLGGASAGLLFVAGPLIGDLLDTPAVVPIIRWLCASILIASVAAWLEALLLRANRVNHYYVVMLCAEVVSSVVGVVMLMTGHDLMALVGYRLSVVSLQTIGYLAVIRTLPRLTFSIATAREAFAFGAGLYGSRFVFLASNYGADFLLGLFLNPAAVGLYRISNRIATACSDICMQPMRTLGWVHISKAARNGGQLSDEWLGLLLMLTVVIWPGLAALAMLAGPMVTLVLGPAWAEAADIVVLLAAARALLAFELFLEPVLGAQNAARRVFEIRLFGAVVTLTLVLLLSPYGPEMAALGTLIAAALVALIAIAILKRRTGASVREIVAALTPSVSITALMILATLAAKGALHVDGSSDWWHLGAVLTVAAAAWSLLVLAVFSRQILAVVRRLHIAK